MRVRTAGLRWAGAVGALGCTAVFVWSPTAAKADVTTFNASAVAYPFRMATTNPTFPLGVPYEGYGPFASTTLTSIGAADAVAAGPYPGPVAVQGPGLVNATTGVQLPNYPFYLQAEAGEGAKHVANPFSSLSASSNLAVVTADAVMGSDFSGATSRARSEVLEFGAIRSSAESTYDVLELSNNIEIRGLRSVAKAASENGKLTRTSSFEFNSISAPGLVYQSPCTPPPQSGIPGNLPCGKSEGLVISFRDGKFLVSPPDGEQRAVPADAGAIKSAFKAISVTVNYQEPTMTTDGIVGAGLSIAYDLPEVPENPTGVAGVSNQRFEIGFASAEARSATAADGVGSDTGPKKAMSAFGPLAVIALMRTRTGAE